MGVMYFKRFRMERDLTGPPVPHCTLPPGYSLVPWSPDLVTDHAETKYASFRMEIDANVFPCLGTREGCLNLMGEICRKECFLPEATWLVRYDVSQSGKWEYCGTIQAVRNKRQTAAIQNLGITPEHRNRCLGTCLLHQSLLGIQQSGIRTATLEVTARNRGAIRLYRRVGFRTVRTVYKSVEASYA